MSSLISDICPYAEHSDGCNTDGYVLQPVGTCRAGTDFIETDADCAAAAASLGLSDIDPGATTTSTNPHGCYFKESNIAASQLWLNPDGDKADADTDRVSLCRCCEDQPDGTCLGNGQAG